MPLSSGTQLGPYRIESPLGAGGMGEVYKATDTRLDRTVAIKVLPGHLSENPELRARFDREAKTVSGLQHPHICSLFDVGHEEGIDFLVMEHLEGTTLAARLANGPLPAAEVLKFGQQITAALGSAHKAGVVHRDLKPGNIMLTPSGVKLLDFGLAKTAEGQPKSDSSFSSLPTMQRDSEPLTTEGTILGTYQYMSPEQLEGKESDARSDIFALGAVLYEMATGRRAFEGESQASLIASIMSSTPAPVSTIHTQLPPAFDQVVATCLEKNPEDRWGTAHDVGLQLKWIAEGGSQVGVPKSVAVRRHRRERVSWGLAALGLIAAGVFAAMLLTAPEPPTPRTYRFEIPAPASLVDIGSPRLSPDGRTIAFEGTDTTGTTQIWVRPMNSTQAYPLPGTEGSGRVFWSPDSRNLGFITDVRIKRVPIAGGPPLTLAEFPTGADGNWGRGGFILMDGTSGDSINAVPEGGGSRIAATTIDRANGENTHGWPFFLPDGERFLFVAWREDEEHQIRLGRMGSFETSFVTRGDSRLEYLEPGYLVYEREGTLLAQPFDADKAEITGDAFPLTDEVGTGGFGLAHFSGSDNGTLIYTVAQGTRRVMGWYDRTGFTGDVQGAPSGYSNPRLSPNGRWLAFQMANELGTGSDIWIEDLRRGTRTRLTFSESGNCCPVWSPDGRRLVFGSDRNGAWQMFVRNADGTGEVQEFATTTGTVFPFDWSRDGSYFVGMQRVSGLDVVGFPVQDGVAGEIEILIQTPNFDGDPAISPDGRYLAYASSDGSANQVYLTTMPPGGGRWQVSSTRGGDRPFWRADGRELFFHDDGTGALYAVDIDLTNGVELGIPRQLFPTQIDQGIATRNYATVTEDGQRFLVVDRYGTGQLDPITVVTNWATELEER